jgi:hypothetical protein
MWQIRRAWLGWHWKTRQAALFFPYPPEGNF